jgi:hypothetical protein
VTLKIPEHQAVNFKLAAVSKVAVEVAQFCYGYKRKCSRL